MPSYPDECLDRLGDWHWKVPFQRQIRIEDALHRRGSVRSATGEGVAVNVAVKVDIPTSHEIVHRSVDIGIRRSVIEYHDGSIGQVRAYRLLLVRYRVV